GRHAAGTQQLLGQHQEFPWRRRCLQAQCSRAVRHADRVPDRRRGRDPRPASYMSTGLLTDPYELTMLDGALRDATAHRHCVFGVFARRLPDGRRYGVVAGTTRLLDAVRDFTFDAATVERLHRAGVVGEQAAALLAGYRFRGDIDGYPEGELYFPYSPV